MKEYTMRILLVVVLLFGMTTTIEAASSNTGIKFFRENRPIEVIVEEEKEEERPQSETIDTDGTHLPQTGSQLTTNWSLMGMILLAVGIKLKKESWKKDEEN